jgi:hypothetical protein
MTSWRSRARKAWVGAEAMEVLDEIDAAFDAMSGPEHADQWTDVAVCRPICAPLLGRRVRMP